MAMAEDFRELLYWSDEWWPDFLNIPGDICDCAQRGKGPRHHELKCPFIGWAWEQKARHLLGGGHPGGDPSEHLRPRAPREGTLREQRRREETA